MSQDKQNDRKKSNEVTPAAVAQDLYIGGVRSKNSDELKAMLKSVGIHNASNVTPLAQNDDWYSYKVSLTQNEFTFAMSSCVWPTGLRIRPFRETQKSRPKSERYRRGPGPSNQRQSSSNRYEETWPAPRRNHGDNRRTNQTAYSHQQPSRANHVSQHTRDNREQRAPERQRYAYGWEQRASDRYQQYY